MEIDGIKNSRGNRGIKVFKKLVIKKLLADQRKGFSSLDTEDIRQSN